MTNAAITAKATEEFGSREMYNEEQWADRINEARKMLRAGR